PLPRFSKGFSDVVLHAIPAVRRSPGQSGRAVAGARRLAARRVRAGESGSDPGPDVTVRERGRSDPAGGAGVLPGGARRGRAGFSNARSALARGAAGLRPARTPAGAPDGGAAARGGPAPISRARG